MEFDINDNNIKTEHLISKISALEKRITILESLLGVRSAPVSLDSDSNESPLKNKINDEEIGLESKIGGFGLALLGNIVLLFGIIFLSQYINNNGFPILASIFGYTSIGCILALSYYSKKKVPHLSFMFNIISLFLLYYFTLRLHFFIETPIITNKLIAVILIFIVILYPLLISIKKKSELYSGITIILALATGLISSSMLIILSLGPIIAIGTVYLFFKFKWQRILILSHFLVYLNFLIWYIINPIATNVLFFQYSHYFLMISAAVFSIISLTPKKELISKNLILSTILINGIIFSIILSLFVSTYFKDNFTEIFLIISAFCMVFSIILKTRSEWKFAPALYAMYGFVAISISVFGIFKLPYTYLLLSFQSLYVLIIALWFRSILIVILNTFLFIMLLLIYLFNSESIDSINFSFVAVSIITANILNWKRKLLGIETELLRYIYLIISFFMVLLSLFKLISDQYITLSWVIVGILYFIDSILFKDVKYRWMAILTMLATAFYLFIVDLSRISLAYRVIAFLFLAIISIVLSLYYSKTRKATESNQDNIIDKTIS